MEIGKLIEIVLELLTQVTKVLTKIKISRKSKQTNVSGDH